MAHDQIITIGIACFNSQNSILRAIKSALKQNWCNKEIIIVDDASTDDSVSVISSYIKNLANIKLIIHKNNRGVGSARQTILDQATGDFIAFFDDDDESLPERLEKQYECICDYENKTGEKLIACYASGERRYKNGYKVALEAIGSKSVIPFGEDVANRLLFYGGRQDFFYGTGTPTCSLMARKTTFNHVGGFDPSFRRVEDVEFAIRLSLASGHFIGCKEVLFIQYATESFHKSPENNLSAEVQLVDKYQSYLRTKGYYTYAREWPKLRYYHFKREYYSLVITLICIILRNPTKAVRHFLKTAPKRLNHDRKIRARTI